MKIEATTICAVRNNGQAAIAMSLFACVSNGTKPTFGKSQGFPTNHPAVISYERSDWTEIRSIRGGGG